MDSDKTLRMVESSPQIHKPGSTAQIMGAVCLALAPAGLWGVWVFGLRALLVLGLSVGAAVLGEALVNWGTGRRTLGDFSAVLTGLLVGYNMPPDVKLYIPVVASLFAILVVKAAFGGLGANWMNPALAGRVFVFFSWTGSMTTWRLPRTVSRVAEITGATAGADAMSAATPLGMVKTALADGASGSSWQIMETIGLYRSELDRTIVGFLNDTFGWAVKPGSADLFFGNVPGCIGEVSALLLILGGIYLLIRKVITWEIPVAYIGSFAILIWIFGGLRYGNGFFSGDVWFHLFSGGLMLGAIFMATDMVTSPLTRKGQIIFGIGAGLFTFLIRIYGSFPEGVSLAIIVMNIFVPMIDRITGPKRFGMTAAAKGEKA